MSDIHRALTSKPVKFLMEGLNTAIAAIPGIVGISHPVAGAAIGTTVIIWQTTQARKFSNNVEKRLALLEEEQINAAYLESDEFKALLFAFAEAASRATSDLKIEALARALVNTTTLDGSQFSGKVALLRILRDMSDEEMRVITVLYQAGLPSTQSIPSPAIPFDINSYKSISMLNSAIAQQLGWRNEDARVTCQGLRQLGLVREPIVQVGKSLVPNDESLWLTELAIKLIRWCSEHGESSVI